MVRVAIKSLVAASLALSLAVAITAVASAQQSSPVEVTTLFPNVVVDSSKDKVTITINVANTSTTGQSFDLVVADPPKGWEPVLKARGFVVRKMYLAAGKSDTVDFQVQPPEGVESQDYAFLLKALGSGGTELSTLKLTVGIQPKVSGGLKMTSQFPSLRGPSRNKFEFSLDLTNNADEDRNYNLSAVAPQGWEASFKPAYEDKQIPSIALKANENKTVNVQVQPPEKAPAGEYPIKVSAAAGNQKADVDLKITLTGTYEMSLTTSSGRLNAQATAGQTSPFSILASNTGSANLEKVTFSSSKPEGWEVKFDPETVDAIEAGALRQVNVTVKPSAKAIAGDYIISLTASTSQTSKSMDVRVTVETPTYWGWLGAGIIVLVVGGLYVVYRYAGRR